jgi:hypothetical protein
MAPKAVHPKQKQKAVGGMVKLPIKGGFGMGV